MCLFSIGTAGGGAEAAAVAQLVVSIPGPQQSGSPLYASIQTRSQTPPPPAARLHHRAWHIRHPAAHPPAPAVHCALPHHPLLHRPVVCGGWPQPILQHGHPTRPPRRLAAVHQNRRGFGRKNRCHRSPSGVWAHAAGRHSHAGPRAACEPRRARPVHAEDDLRRSPGGSDGGRYGNVARERRQCRARG